MLSMPLMIQNFKENWKGCLLAAVLVLAAFFGAACFYYYDARTAVETIFDWIPLSLLNALGMNRQIGNLTEYFAISLYCSVMIWVPMIFTLILANRMIAEKVDNKRMTFLLSLPKSRECIAGTLLVFMLLCLFVFFFLTTVSGIIFCIVMLPGELEIGKFLLLNLGIFLLQSCLGCISFFASCICDEEQVSLMLGAGIPILFYLIYLLANTGGVSEYVGYFTLFTLYSPIDIVEGGLRFIWTYPLMFVIGTCFALTGIHLFNKRDLPL